MCFVEEDKSSPKRDESCSSQSELTHLKMLKANLTDMSVFEQKILHPTTKIRGSSKRPNAESIIKILTSNISIWKVRL